MPDKPFYQTPQNAAPNVADFMAKLQGDPQYKDIIQHLPKIGAEPKFTNDGISTWSPSMPKAGGEDYVDTITGAAPAPSNPPVSPVAPAPTPAPVSRQVATAPAPQGLPTQTQSPGVGNVSPGVATSAPQAQAAAPKKGGLNAETLGSLLQMLAGTAQGWFHGGGNSPGTPSWAEQWTERQQAQKMQSNQFQQQLAMQNLQFQQERDMATIDTDQKIRLSRATTPLEIQKIEAEGNQQRLAIKEQYAQKWAQLQRVFSMAGGAGPGSAIQGGSLTGGDVKDLMKGFLGGAL